MCRLFSSIVTRLTLLITLTVLTWSAPALATIATWYFHDVTLADGGSVTGYFTCDSHNYPWDSQPYFTMKDFNIVINFADLSSLITLEQGMLPPNPVPSPVVLSPDNYYYDLYASPRYIDFRKYSFFGPVGGCAIELDMTLENYEPMMDPGTSYSLIHEGDPYSKVIIKEAAWHDPLYFDYVNHYKFYDAITGGYVSTEVPLPSTFLLLGSGLLGLAGWRRFGHG